MTDQNERPLGFRAQEVRAILGGTKTQTRRALKPRRDWIMDERDDGRPWPFFQPYVHGEAEPVEVPCPHGVVGDRLWVQETWALLKGNGHRVVFRADADPPMTCGGTEPVRDMKWTPSIHMPRWASRILLEITDVRVERLQSISEEDARAEGAVPLPLQSADDPSAWWSADPSDPCLQGRTPSQAFSMLWVSINGATSWDADIWVWVLSFRVMEDKSR